MLKTFLTISFLAFFTSFSQTVYYQDVFKGGVCVVGTSSWEATGSVDLPYFIEPFSQIKKIFLVSYTAIPIVGDVFSTDVYIDGIPFNLNDSHKTGIVVDNAYNPIITGSIGYESYVIDITNDYYPINPTINITHTINGAPASCPSCHFAAPVLVILYENLSLNKLNFALVLNDGEESNENYIQLNSLNSADVTSDIGIGVHMDRLSGFSNDGYHFSINSNYVGYLNGPDTPSIGNGGVIGCFYYQNDLLNGLTDDIANDIMQGSDGIMRLNNFYTGSLNGTVFKTVYGTGSPNNMHNIFVGMNFAYSTPCDTFSVSLSPDTTICAGIPLQLTASGGVSYQWEPSIDLSCSTCPNPVFMSDSSRQYRVRIWNNDSCSVIRPVHVNVRPKPEFESITISPSNCGTNSGSVSLSSSSNNQSPVTYIMNSTLTQSAGLFSNLTSGNNTFQIEDGFGCLSDDTIVFVPEINTTNAGFTVSPNFGTAPLTIQINNTSQNATDYLWTLNGANEGSSLSSFTCDTSGIYTIQLIAWQYDPSCADTAFNTITVIDQLIIPTAFTPDNDGVNDFWILPNIDEIYPNNVAFVYNRWGEQLFQSEKGKYIIRPWNGKYNDEILPVGSYYFIIKTHDQKEEIFKGVVSIIK